MTTKIKAALLLASIIIEFILSFGLFSYFRRLANVYTSGHTPFIHGITRGAEILFFCGWLIPCIVVAIVIVYSIVRYLEGDKIL